MILIYNKLLFSILLFSSYEWDKKRVTCVTPWLNHQPLFGKASRSSSELGWNFTREFSRCARKNNAGLASKYRSLPNPYSYADLTSLISINKKSAALTELAVYIKFLAVAKKSCDIKCDHVSSAFNQMRSCLLSTIVAHTTRKTVNRLARKNLYLNHVVPKRQITNKVNIREKPNLGPKHRG